MLVYMGATCTCVGITFTMYVMSTHLLNICLVTDIYYKRDVLKIPRVNPSLTIAPGKCHIHVYIWVQLQCICVIVAYRTVMIFRSIQKLCDYLYLLNHFHTQ